MSARLCCRAFSAQERVQQAREQGTTHEIRVSAFPAETAQEPYHSEGLRPVLAFSHKPMPKQAAVVIRPTGVEQNRIEPQPPSNQAGHPMAPSFESSQPVGSPGAQFVDQCHIPLPAGARLMPMSHSYALSPQLFHQSITPYPYVPPVGMAASADSVLQGNAWRHNATTSSYNCAAPIHRTMHAYEPPPFTPSPHYYVGGHYPPPGAHIGPQQASDRYTSNSARQLPPKAAAMPSPTRASANISLVHSAASPVNRNMKTQKQV